MSPKKVLSIVDANPKNSESIPLAEFYSSMLQNEGYFSFYIGLKKDLKRFDIVNWKEFANYLSESLCLEFQAFPFQDLKVELLSFIDMAHVNDTKKIEFSYGCHLCLQLNCILQSNDTIVAYFKSQSTKHICLNQLEESFTRHIQEVVDMACFVYDFNTNEVIASQWIYHLLEKDRLIDGNIPVEELLNLLSKAERYCLLAGISDAVENHHDVSVTTALIDKQGKYYYLKIAGSVCENDKGEPSKFHGTVLDVSEQIETHKEALLENERLSEFYNHTRILFDSIKDFIWSKDVEGRFVFANNAMCRRILGARFTEEPIGKTEQFFIERQHIKPDDKIFRMCEPFDIMASDSIVLENLVSQRYEIEGEFSGTTCFLEIQKTPVIDAQGKLMGLVGTARDITVRKKVEKELKRSKHRLTESQELAKIGHWEHSFITGKTAWSKEFYRVFNLDNRTVKPSLDLMYEWIVPEDKQSIIKAYKDAFALGKSFNYTYRIAINNEIIYVRDICKVTRNEDGLTRKVYGTIQDISELKRSEMLAIRNRRRLENTVRALPDQVAIVDKNFTLVDYYLGSSNELLLPLDELQNKSLSIALSDTDSRNLKRCIVSSLEQGDIQVYEFPFAYKGKGREHFLEIRLSPFEENKVVMVISDRTAQKQTQVKLQNATKKAEESDRLKSAFIANMSHEIRTPLNAIVGFSNLLGDDDMQPYDKERFLEIIARNSDQLLALISDIIDVSKIESDQLEVDLGYIDLNSFLKRIFKQFEDQLIRVSKEKIQLKSSFAHPDRKVILKTDQIRIEQIVSNLINNALKFTENGFIEIGYHLRKKGRIVIFVTDSGIGIAKKNHKIIFEQFRQEDFSITRKYGGTGLGLSICRKLAVLMGGDITVKSAKGKGATFFLELPYVENLATVAFETD